MSVPFISSETSLGSWPSGPANQFLDIPITVNAGVDQIVLVVGAISREFAGPVSFVGTPTFDGNNMTLIDTSTFGGGNSYATFAAYHVGPAPGVGKIFHVEYQSAFGGNCNSAFQIYIIDNVKLDVVVRALAAGSAGTLAGIACYSNDLIIDLVVSEGGSPGPGGEGAGQTPYMDRFITPGAYNGNVGTSSKIAVTTSETMSWSTNLVGIVRHLGIPVASKPSGFFLFM